MNTALLQRDNDNFGGGITGAVVLHIILFCVVAALSYFTRAHREKWGDTQEVQGAIQASMVSAIPLPHEAKPIEKQVLAPEVTSPAPAPPKPATITPPKPTDIEIKAKQPPPPKTAKVAPVETPPPPKHVPPTPETPTKATTGQAASQLMTSTVQVGTGSSTITVLDRSMGSRYAYYFGIVNRTIAQNWYKNQADPRASTGRKVTLLFDIARDGTPSNVRVETRSGSPTLDDSAVRALERINTFGPSPAPGTVTIEDTFVYDNP